MKKFIVFLVILLALIFIVKGCSYLEEKEAQRMAEIELQRKKIKADILKKIETSSEQIPLDELVEGIYEYVDTEKDYVFSVIFDDTYEITYDLLFYRSAWQLRYCLLISYKGTVIFECSRRHRTKYILNSNPEIYNVHTRKAIMLFLKAE
jgi:hypothetical protein